MTPNHDAKSLIQLVRSEAWGDVLMTTAVFPGLIAQEHRLRYLTQPAFVPMLTHNPSLTDVLGLPLFRNNNPMRRWRLTRRVQAETRELEAPARTIYFSNPRNHAALRKLMKTLDPTLDERLLPLTHQIALFCRQAGVPLNDTLQVCLTDAERAWGEQYRECILVQPSSSNSGKDWPMSQWPQLARKLSRTTGLPVYALAAPDQPVPEGVARLPNTGMREAMAAVAACRLFIGVDSVFNHVTRAFQKPALILWGVTRPERFGYAQNLNLWRDRLVTPALGGPVNPQMEKARRILSETAELPALTDPSAHPHMTMHTAERVFQLAMLLLEANVGPLKSTAQGAI